MKLLIALVVATGLAIVMCDEVDYCNIYHCGEKHIACNNDGQLGEACPPGASVVNMTLHKNYILDLHNQVRNVYAAGVGSLPKAGRMAQMVWCDELESLALLNVKKCILEADECHSITAARYSGQNIGLYSYITSKNMKTVDWLIENRFSAWINDSENVLEQHIASYPDTELKKPIGHFTLIVNEKNTHVGCAAIRYKKNDIRNFLLTCNYATDNIIGRPVYTANEVAGADCQTDTSIVYTSLCTIDEKYDNIDA